MRRAPTPEFEPKTHYLARFSPKTARKGKKLHREEIRQCIGIIYQIKAALGFDDFLLMFDFYSSKC